MTDALVEASGQAIDLAVRLLATTDPREKTYKTDRDFATAADLLIEREVRTLLEKLTPGVPFFGEEYGGPSSTGTYWCLDPIDGTLNYSRGIPIHGISLAYASVSARQPDSRLRFRVGGPVGHYLTGANTNCAHVSRPHDLPLVVTRTCGDSCHEAIAG